MLIDILNALTIITNFILIPGLTYGSQLALGALGVTLIYSILRFSNFAHGEMMSFSAMVTLLVTWWLQEKGISAYPLPTALLALPASIAVTILLVLVSDRLVFRYYRKIRAPPVTLLIVSMGLMFFVHGLTRFIIGPEDRILTDGERFILKAKSLQRNDRP